MKVSMLVASASRTAGGVFPALQGLSSRLERDVSVTIIAGRDVHTEKDLGAWGSIAVATYNVVGPKTFAFSPALRRLIASSSPDIVHVHGLWAYQSYEAIRWSSLPNGGRYIVSPHGMLNEVALQRSKIKKRIAMSVIEGAHLRRASCLHALCEAEAISLRTMGLRNAIAVIPNGVEIPTLNPTAIRSVDKGALELLFLGRIHPQKGVIELVHAWKRLVESLGEIRWVLKFAGWGDSKHVEELKRTINSLNLGQSVQYLGPQYGEAKISLLASADAFVLPSFSEGLPMAVLEAWAYGLPVLMTRQCNLPEGFTADAALEIQPTVEGICASLHRLVAMSSTERARFGQNGRLLAERRFSWAAIAHSMREVYAWIQNGGEAPATVWLR